MEIRIQSKRNDVLKLIAIITMFIDHIGYFILPEIRDLRVIGRIAFPIFAYMIAMGYIHTSNRKTYAKRLFLFGLISQPFYMLFSVKFDPFFINPFAFNVMFLLLLGLGFLHLWDQFASSAKKLKTEFSIFNLLAAISNLIVFVVVGFLPRVTEILFQFIYSSKYDMMWHFQLSYGSYGLFLILIFYLFHKKPMRLMLFFVIMSMISSYIGYSVYFAKIERHDTPLTKLEKSVDAIMDTEIPHRVEPNSNVENKFDFLLGRLKTFQWPFFQFTSLLGVLIIILLQNIRFAFTMPQAFAYIFYPAHIGLIFLYKYFEIGKYLFGS